MYYGSIRSSFPCFAIDNDLFPVALVCQGTPVLSTWNGTARPLQASERAVLNSSVCPLDGSRAHGYWCVTRLSDAMIVPFLYSVKMPAPGPLVHPHAESRTSAQSTRQRGFPSKRRGNQSSPGNRSRRPSSLLLQSITMLLDWIGGLLPGAAMAMLLGLVAEGPRFLAKQQTAGC
jgi:hypothetical protein